MKIQLIERPKTTELSYNGSIITANGVEYDFNNLSAKPEPIIEKGQDADGNEIDIVTNQAEIDDMLFWKDEQGIDHGQISVSPNKSEANPEGDGSSFLMLGIPFKHEGKQYVCQNLYLFHDKDCNGDFSIDELQELIDCINKPSEDREAEHEKFKRDWGWPEGKTLSQLPKEKQIEWLMKGVAP